MPGMASCFPLLPWSPECQFLTLPADGENESLVRLLVNSTHFFLLLFLLYFSSSSWTKNQICTLKTPQPDHAIHPAPGPSSLVFPGQGSLLWCFFHPPPTSRSCLTPVQGCSPELPLHWTSVISVSALFLLAFKFALLCITSEVSWV